MQRIPNKLNHLFPVGGRVGPDGRRMDVVGGGGGRGGGDGDGGRRKKRGTVLKGKMKPLVLVRKQRNLD